MKTNWDIKKLGEVCTVIAGQSPEGKFYNGNGIGLPFYQGKKEFQEKFIGPATTWTSKTTKIAESGDILMSVRAPVGPTNFATEAICIGRGLAAIRPLSILRVDFIYYFLKMYESEIVGNQGAVFNSISKQQIENIEMPIPSLAEQKRIVKKLDEVFLGLGEVRDKAERNLSNARELFESYLQGMFENKNNKWPITKLSELSISITDGDHMPPPKSQTGIPFITISNINKQSHKIDFSDTFNVSSEYYTKLKDNRKPKHGDVLYTVTGSFGIPVIVESNFEFCFQRHIGLIRPNQEVDSKWLYYLILTPSILKQGKYRATGTAQKTVSLNALRNFVVFKVPLNEQKMIVKKLDALSEQSKELEAIFRKKIADVDELKKSVLQKAFAGEL